MLRRALAVLLLVGFMPVGGAAHAAPVARCQVFPKDNYWHADVSRLPLDPHSKTWLAHMNTGRMLHPDFGPSFGDGPNYGIPVTVVTRRHPKVRVRFDDRSESDRVRYPLGKDTKIEGGRNSGGDRHAIVVDKTTCRLYETWNTRKVGRTWRAGSGAVWSLKRNSLRPDGWTSADAAGLPILPGLLRWPEVKAGRVDHAIRFTMSGTASHHLWPARHDAGMTTSQAYPPMGARFRLAADFDTSGYTTYARTVLQAMKKYGIVLADNGSDWYFQGARSGGWPDRLISELKTIPASAFEAVDTAKLPHTAQSAAVAPAA